MPTLDDALPYAAALISAAAGIFGFFWARGGERNKAGGIGWSALVFIIAAGIVTVTQIHRQGSRAAAAGAKADELNNELRRTQYVTRAAILTLISGFDLGRPVRDGILSFELPYEGEHPIAIDRFVGPFPLLPRGATGRLLVRIDGIAHADYRLAPADGGALRLTSAQAGLRSYTLRRAGDAFQFDPEEHVGLGWSAQPESVGDDDTPQGRTTFNYALNFPAENQFRRLIWQLSSRPSFGRIELTVPGMSEADIDRIVGAYERMTVRLVFNAATLPENAAAGEECQPSYIRVPLKISREPAAGTGRVVLNIGPAMQAFEPEPCEGAP